MKKMPFAAWVVFLLVLGGCGFWTYLTPTDNNLLFERRVEAFSYLATPIPWVILAIVLFVIFFPPKFGRR